ncbi:MAG: long-chain fatty acid--CoA ligase [Alphaproteobacteria bacterium]|nr:long-chain fatty acid--CoA ligase [Alphaproteobacteria bacterium]
MSKIPVSSVTQLLDQAVSKHGTASALDFFGRKWTYHELGALVDQAAAGFRAMGVRKGVNVGICMPNTPYSVVCYFAILKAGGTVVNYNPLYVERELMHQVTDSQTRIMVTVDLKMLYGKIDALLSSTKLESVVVCRMAEIMPANFTPPATPSPADELIAVTEDSKHILLGSLIKNGTHFSPDVLTPEKDLAVLQYTGGTTGVPKGAMLTHANITVNVAQMQQWIGVTAAPPQDRMLCVLPLFHVFAMTVVMDLGVSLGAEIILLPRFDLAQTMGIIAKSRPTIVAAVPTIYGAIAAAAAANGGKFDMSFVRFAVSGGAPLPVELAQGFAKLTGCHLVEGYGLSETAPVATCGPLNAPPTYGSAGLPVPGTRIEIRSAEDPKKKLPVNERGEIVIFGPQVMAGYWQKPEDTRAVMIDGGFRTGDIGYLDDKGFIYIVDRIKDMILCSGYNVYPRIIEEAIYLHKDVVGAIVIGIPDSYRGQSPKAFVQLREGAKLSEAELTEFLKDKLSVLELPKSIEFRDTLPKTTVGKLSKKTLVDEEAAKAAKW